MYDLLVGYCCICIAKDSHLENIQDLDENKVKYSDKLKFCIPNKNWEKHFSLCRNCTEKLEVVYEFMQLCQKAQHLHEIKVSRHQEAREGKLEEIKPEIIFECGICKKIFKQKRFLKLHTTRIHSNQSFDFSLDGLRTQQSTKIKAESSCKTEAQEVLKKEEIQDDVKTEGLNYNKYEDSSDIFCENNDSVVASDSESEEKLNKTFVKLRKQYKTKRKDPLNCEYCGKLFKRRQHWSAHIRANHTFEKPYVCNLCNASFVNSHSLLVHKRNHNNEKPYVCTSCGKSFVCSGDLYHHSKIHLNKREYKCNFCDKCFNTTSILRTHKIVKHVNPENWKYACQMCNRRFPINSSLVVHMKRHIGVRDFSCHICEKKFFNKSEVSKHVLSHSDERHFKCEICGSKEYKNREGLRKHLKLSHDVGNWKAPKVVKKFQCTMCPKVFAFNNKLQRHIFTHTGEKPFKCEYCEKKFVDNYYRKVHLKKEHNLEVVENDKLVGVL